MRESFKISVALPIKSVFEYSSKRIMYVPTLPSGSLTRFN